MTQTTAEHEHGTAGAGATEHLVHLATFPDKLAALLREQPPEALIYRPSEASWSITEALGHLIVFGSKWGNRIRQMLGADGAHFVRMDADDDVQRFGFQHQQSDDLLAGFAARRAERVTFLQGLQRDDLERTGTHPDYGTISVADAIRILAENDAERHRQIMANLQAFHETYTVNKAGS